MGYDRRSFRMDSCTTHSGAERQCGEGSSGGRRLANMCIKGRALDGAKAARRLWRLDFPVYTLAAPFYASDASRYEIMASTTRQVNMTNIPISMRRDL